MLASQLLCIIAVLAWKALGAGSMVGMTQHQSVVRSLRRSSSNSALATSIGSGDIVQKRTQQPIVRRVAVTARGNVKNETTSILADGSFSQRSNGHQEGRCATSRSIPDRVPSSFEEAVKNPELSDTNCYAAGGNKIIDAGRCCCSFWNAPVASLETTQMLLHSPSKLSGACFESFPEYSRPLATSAAASCGNIAIGVSGKWSEPLDQILNRVKGIVEPLEAVGKNVDVFFHVAGIPVPGNSTLPKWVKGLVIENANSAEAKNAAQKCTQGLVDKSFAALSKRRGGVGASVERSQLHMHRHIFLAYLMASKYAAAASCKYEHYIRTRPDIMYKEDFSKVFKQLESSLQKTPVLTAAAANWLYVSRSQGAPPMERCVVDDQFAFGEFTAMSAYTTVFPDFTDFVRYIPFYRKDVNGHNNERVLTAHLHYRNASFGDFSLNYDLHKR